MTTTLRVLGALALATLAFVAGAVLFVLRLAGVPTRRAYRL